MWLLIFTFTGFEQMGLPSLSKSKHKQLSARRSVRHLFLQTSFLEKIALAAA